MNLESLIHQPIHAKLDVLSPQVQDGEDGIIKSCLLLRGDLYVQIIIGYIQDEPYKFTVKTIKNFENLMKKWLSSWSLNNKLFFSFNQMTSVEQRYCDEDESTNYTMEILFDIVFSVNK